MIERLLLDGIHMSRHGLAVHQTRDSVPAAGPHATRPDLARFQTTRLRTQITLPLPRTDLMKKRMPLHFSLTSPIHAKNA